MVNPNFLCDLTIYLTLVSLCDLFSFSVYVMMTRTRFLYKRGDSFCVNLPPIFFLVLFLPEGGGEDGYQCDDFKTACQHQDGHDPLARGGQEIVRTGDARYTRT